MSISHKPAGVQVARLMVYRRPLHPELFNLHGRRIDRHGDYEVESWLSHAGHVVRFQIDDEVVTETVIENADHLPETGLLHALPCLGEKEFEMEPDGRIGYVTTIQTEALTDNLYTSTLDEISEFARETGSLCEQWTDPMGSLGLSVLDTQKYKSEFHIQSYHLLGSSGIVLRTQSIFELV